MDARPFLRHRPWLETWRPALTANRHHMKKLLIVYIYESARLTSKA